MASGSAERRPERLPRLHLVTDDRVVAGAGFAALAERLIGAGGPRLALHLRTRAGGRVLHPLAERLSRAARAAGAALLVNERVDVALAAGAAGVQLGRTAMRPPDARRLLGAGAWIGASVHTPAEARESHGADFLLAGTIFPSASHPGGAASGTGWLSELTALGLPVVGIGGVTAARVPELLAAGAYGVAVVRAVWDASDPQESLGGLLERLPEPGGEG